MHFYTILKKRLVNQMLWYEVKKIFAKRMNRLVLVLLLFALVLISFWTIRDVRYLHEDGETMDIGITAAHQLKEAKSQWRGFLTEDILQQVIEENQKINASPEAISDEDKGYAKGQAFYDIRDMINRAFVEFEGDYDWYRMDQVAVEEVGSMYEQRVTNLKNWLKKVTSDSYSKQEQEFLIRKYETLKTPLFYDYYEGWKALLCSAYLNTLLIIVVLIIGFLVAGIFSDEFLLKADAIFFSTKFGRSKAVGAKIGAGFLVITAIYWVFMFLYSGIVLGILGFQGAKCAIQVNIWDTFYNLNFIQYYWLVMWAGYVGCLCIISISMFVSVKTHSAVLAISITFILTCLTPFLSRIPLLKNVMESFPEMLLRLTTEMDAIRLYQLGDKVFGAFELLIPMYFLLSLLFIPFLYFSYRKTQKI
jgi:hypothetical protein